MRTYLQYQLSVSFHQREDDMLRLLMQDGPEQEIIRKWCEKGHGKHYITSPNLPDDVEPCTHAEQNLLTVHRFLVNFFELDSWEMASQQVRIEHGLRVAKLARELARELKNPDGPYYPSVLQFFDEDCAVTIIKAMPEDTQVALLSCTRYAASPDGGAGIDTATNEQLYLSAARALAARVSFPAEQTFSPLLERLADYAQKKIVEPRRDARPNTGDANARAFAKSLAEDFKILFGRIPNEVIAACVCLRYPEMESPPNADTIRDWRGAR
jgi:hypothetical protein